MEEDNAAPAKGPAREMSTFALRSGRMDLNCRNQEKMINAYLASIEGHSTTESHGEVLAKAIYTARKCPISCNKSTIDVELDRRNKIFRVLLGGCFQKHTAIVPGGCFQEHTATEQPNHLFLSRIRNKGKQKMEISSKILACNFQFPSIHCRKMFPIWISKSVATSQDKRH
ncbi:hypothetical protein H5410_053847 [Solanum commersonii]|uniref:Uncharacterized protein n=1 Tax=Solanum commersonii TaxID=4109 RepID=A0A9J5X7I6_SOLCO|nr:hypothetical protein H5410_053847 [Solanum commersonii]